MADPVRFNEIIQVMRDSGYFGTLLPFLLVWVIIYGLLKKLNVFAVREGNTPGGTIGRIIPNDTINIVISTIISLYVTVFSPFATPLNLFFSSFFTQSVLAMIILLVSLLFMALIFFMPFWKHDDTIFANIMKTWFPLLLGLAIIGMGVIFVTSGGIELFRNYVPASWRFPYIDSYWWALIIAAILIVVTMFIASRTSQ